LKDFASKRNEIGQATLAPLLYLKRKSESLINQSQLRKGKTAMAKTAKTLPPGFVPQATRTKVLPWNDIFASQEWVILTSGEDFQSSVGSFISNAKDQARSRGFKLQTATSTSSSGKEQVALLAEPISPSAKQATKSSIKEKVNASRRKGAK
jgi:hypothetical protein